MPLAPTDRRSYLARQVGTLALSQLDVHSPMSFLRAARWHNLLLRMGLPLPLFVVRDLGLMLSLPRGPAGWRLAPDPVEPAGGQPAAHRPLLLSYRDLLERLASSEIVSRAGTWRLRDELVAVVIARILGATYQSWESPGKHAGARELPLEPGVYVDADVAAHFADFDAAPLWDFVEHLSTQVWHVYTLIEQIDLDTLRLIGMFKKDQDSPLSEVIDLFHVLRTPEAGDIANFSLELLPSVLETKRVGGAQSFAVDGYTSIERRGNLDSLVLTELAWDDDLFDRKLANNELFYYGHERPREEERRLEYILVDSSASMRGQRQVFARGLALTLAKKLSLAGEEVWLRFFDSRLSDVLKVSDANAFNVPYFLSFRSERGRNYARVFRQLLAEVQRLRRVTSRTVVLTIITHGQCHIPVELVRDLGKHAVQNVIIVLPSSEVTLEYLSLVDRHQIVSEESLRSRGQRRDRALDIVEDRAEGALARGPGLPGRDASLGNADAS